MVENTLNEYLFKCNAYEEFISNMSDFEKDVMEDIIEYGETLRLTRYDSLQQIFDLTNKYWEEMLRG